MRIIARFWMLSLLFLTGCSLDVEMVHLSAKISDGPPQIKISQPDPLSGDSSAEFKWTVSYSNVTNITLSPSDISLEETGVTDCEILISGTGLERIVTVTHCNGNGDVKISINSGTAVGGKGEVLSGSGLSEPAVISNSLTRPSLVIATPSPTTGSVDTLFEWQITYQNATSVTLSAADVILNGDSYGCAKEVLSQGLLTKIVRVSQCNGNGLLSISIAANTASNDLSETAAKTGPSTTVELQNPYEVKFAKTSEIMLKPDQDVADAVQVYLNKPLAFDVKVKYTFLEDLSSAKKNIDHNLSDGELTIPAGQQTANINFQFKGGSSSAGSKILQVALLGADRADVPVGAEQVFRKLYKDSTSEEYLKVAVGGRHTCAIIKDTQALKCWGSNSYGQVGDGSTDEIRPPTVIDSGVKYKDISLGVNHSCGLTESGELKCWGDHSSGALGYTASQPQRTPQVVDSPTSYKMVSVGFYHSCGLTSSNTLKCWGENGDGRLGDGTTVSKSTPVQIGSAQYSYVGTSFRNTCAVRLDNSALYCWGYNFYYGAVGDGTTTDRNAPVLIDSEAYLQVSMSENWGCGITSAHQVKCWGGVSSAWRVDGVDSKLPGLVDMGRPYKQISAGDQHVCGISLDDQLRCWGNKQSIGVGAYQTWASVSPSAVIDNGQTYKQIAAGTHNCAVTLDGDMKCWGNNAQGQWGSITGTDEELTQPAPVAGHNDFLNVISGGVAVCGVSSLQDLMCWGRGLYNGFARLAPTLQLNEKVQTIGFSSGSYCVVNASGELKCWGSNYNGTLGNGTTINIATPTIIDEGEVYSDVAMDSAFTCGLTQLGQVKCWGMGYNGRLGNGSTNDQLTPTRVLGGNTYKQVAVSKEYGSHACAINKDDLVECWGGNSSGRLGDGGTTESLIPKLINDSSSYSFISIGNSHTCGILTTGRVKCWGVGSNGRLGTGSTSSVSSPTLINDTTLYSYLSAGNSHTCGVTVAGDLKCWGANSQGQLGDGTTSDLLDPKIVDPGVKYQKVTVMTDQTCGITADGETKCWGVQGTFNDYLLNYGRGHLIGFPNPVQP